MMEQIQKSLQRLQKELRAIWTVLDLDGAGRRFDQLQAKMTAPDFWSDSLAAQGVSKEEARLRVRLGPWLKLQKDVQEAVELAGLGDASLEKELTAQVGDLEERLAAQKNQLKLAGPYDDYDIILAIHAGAGGTDAQDWAGMLLRMYIRWAEKNDFKVTTIDQSDGDEAGIKSVTIELSGEFAYGKLKGEHGVHRLVRLSPYYAKDRPSRSTGYRRKRSAYRCLSLWRPRRTIREYDRLGGANYAPSNRY
jgi:peptide chain release factor 2